MARRKNGEGTWGTKTIKGVVYNYYRKQYGETDKYFYGKTIKEVKAKIKEFEEGNVLILPKEIKKQLFGDYLLQWLQTVKQFSVKRKTYDGYEDIINNQLINFKSYDLAGKQMDSLTTEMFQSYFNELAKQYSKSTISKLYILSNQCLKYAETHGHVKNGLLETVTIPSEDNVAVKKKEIQFLTESDMEKLYEESKRINIEGHNYGGKIGSPVYGNNAQALILIMYTGLRVSELLALTWGDIDLETKNLYVRNSLVTIKNRNKKSKADKNYVRDETSTKTRSGVRKIPLVDRAIEMVNHFNNINPNHKPTDSIIINKKGNVVAQRNLTRTLGCMLVRSGCSVSKCGLHSLRHTFGSYLILNKVDIKVVSYLLGHKDISVTYNTYIHLIEEQKVDAMDIFNKLNKSDNNENK